MPGGFDSHPLPPDSRGVLIAPQPVRSDLVLIGGGHAHVEVLRQLGMSPAPGVRVTLIAREAEAAYSGMLPGHLAGDYAQSECQIDLRPLCRSVGARLIHAQAVGLDLAEGRVRCEGRPPVAFDYLSIDAGGRSDLDRIAGAERAIPAKPVDLFLARIPELFHEDVASIAVVGGGAGSAEVAIALRQRMGTARAVRILLVADGEDILPSHAAAVRRRIRRALLAHRVELWLRCRATAIESKRIVCAGGATIGADRTVLVTSVSPPGWLKEAGLAVDERGFVAVDETLRSTSHPQVFAAGDIAAFIPRPLPKSGVYAVRQGPTLAENLRRAVEGRPLASFRPQRRTLALLRSGKGRAVASWGPFAAEGAWVWRWKDTIDSQWIRRYQSVPRMQGQGESETDMRCGGCAAKIASPILARAIGARPIRERKDVLIGLSAPDDASAIVPPAGVAVIQTVDQFRAFIDDPFLFARIAANHCLNDVYAMGASPQSALALATVPFGSDAAMERDLAALIAGAEASLTEAGAALIGGHSAEGPELAFGLSVTGFAQRDRIWRKGGLRPGDLLILTKPLGTGVLLAAEMRGLAPAACIEAAMRSMLQSNGPAASVLARFDIRGCTDVSGFGLLGHLLEMLNASNLLATLDPARIPAIDGARALLCQGARSTLQPANEAAFGAGVEVAAEPLLFDPQTSGGLLAGIPGDSAAACLAALHDCGFAGASLIGTVRVSGDEARRVDFASLTAGASDL